MMRDHFATAKIHYIEAQMVVSFICLKQSAVCVRSKELQVKYNTKNT